MATNGEKCFGQEVLSWDKCPGLDEDGCRKRMLGRLTCDTCFHAAAYEDELTGLPNRLSLQNTFENLKKESARIGALMIDLSSFKHVNETLGHNSGDVILKHTAQFLKNEIRDSDDFFVSRHGGDEFVVLLKLESREGTELTPEQMLEAAGSRLSEAYSEYGPINQYNLGSSVPKEKKLAIRYGHALWDGDSSLNELLETADPKGKSYN